MFSNAIGDERTYRNKNQIGGALLVPPNVLKKIKNL